MERYVGELAWDWLNGPDDDNTDLSLPTRWRVDLEKPVLDVTLKFFPGLELGMSSRESWRRGTIRS